MRDLGLTEEQTRPYDGRRDSPRAVEYTDERRSGFRLLLDGLGLRRYGRQAPTHPQRDLKGH